MNWLRGIVQRIIGTYRPYEAGRAAVWPRVRDDHLRIEPTCVVCGGKDVAVHHCLPYHLYRNSELDPLNLITLCDEHHFEIGHLRSWKAWNPHVLEDCGFWRRRILARLYKRLA